MSYSNYYLDWRQQIVYGADRPQPTILMSDEKITLILAGLAPGGRIPEHPEAASVYHFLEGDGWMTVDGERLRVATGTTIVLPAGSVRGLEAETRLAFLATRIA